MMDRELNGTGSRRAAGRMNRPGIAEVAKYVVMAVIIVYIVLLMIYASGSTRSFNEIEKAVESVLDTDNLKKAEGQGLKRYYGLNSADYEGVMLYTSESSMSAEEVLLIKVKNEGQRKRVKEAVEKRLANRKNDFEGYAPKEVQLLEQSQLTVRGKFLFLAIAPRAAEYKDTFAKSL